MAKNSTADIQRELSKLLSEQSKLSQLPSLNDPLAYAQKVAEQATRAKQVNDLIVGLRNLLSQRQQEDEQAESARVAEEKAGKLAKVMVEFQACGERLSAISKLQARELLKLSELFRKYEHEVRPLGGSVNLTDRNDGSSQYWLDRYNPGLQTISVETPDSKTIVINTGIRSLKKMGET